MKTILITFQMKTTSLVLLFSILLLPIYAQVSVGAAGAVPDEDIWIMDANPTFYGYAMAITNPQSVDQVDTIQNITALYCMLNKDTCFKLVDHFVKVTEDNKRANAAALKLKGNAYSRFRRDTSGFEFLNAASKIYIADSIYSGAAFIYSDIGADYAKLGMFEQAIAHQVKAMETIQLYGDSVRILPPYVRISGVYLKIGELDRAQKYLSDGIQLAADNNDQMAVPALKSWQAKIYKARGDKYRSIADTISNNSLLLNKDSAQYYYTKGLAEAEMALKAAKEIKIGSYISVAASLVTALKADLGDYNGALKMGQEALTLAERAGIPDNIVKIKKVLAFANLKLGRYDRALEQALSARELAVASNNLESKNQIDLELLEIYEAKGNYKKAFETATEIQQYNEKTNTVSTQTVVREIESKYRTAEKEREHLHQEKAILELSIKNENIQKQKNMLMGGSLLFGLLGFLGFRFNQIRKDRNDKKEFAEALIFAQEEERKRIARDLHDGIGQSLLLIKKQMDTNHETTLQNKQMITDTLEEVRSISRDLHPMHLEKFGLTSSIENILEKVQSSTDIFISKEIDNLDKALNAKAEIHLFRTVQEAFNNIVKHSEATAANIKVKKNTNEIKIIIQDNGKGFDQDPKLVKSKSLGLRTMDERIAAIGGSFQIQKGESGGVVIEIVIPV